MHVHWVSSERQQYCLRFQRHPAMPCSTALVKQCKHYGAAPLKTDRLSLIMARIFHRKMPRDETHQPSSSERFAEARTAWMKAERTPAVSSSTKPAMEQDTGLVTRSFNRAGCVIAPSPAASNTCMPCSCVIQAAATSNYAYAPLAKAGTAAPPAPRSTDRSPSCHVKH